MGFKGRGKERYDGGFEGREETARGVRAKRAPWRIPKVLGMVGAEAGQKKKLKVASHVLSQVHTEYNKQRTRIRSHWGFRMPNARLLIRRPLYRIQSQICTRSVGALCEAFGGILVVGLDKTWTGALVRSSTMLVWSKEFGQVRSS